MDQNRGLVRCLEPLGHDDWARTVLEELEAVGNGQVRLTLRGALVSVASEVPVPAWAIQLALRLEQSLLREFPPLDSDVPF
jgi:hypothetical protein